MTHSTEITSLLAFADTLADAAGAAILPHFRTGIAVANKAASGFDPVTLADQAAERAIRALITARYPDHGVLGEEFGETAGASGYRWVIDPIDGTRAFIAGLPLWGTLIALTHEGVPVLGVMDQPYLGERFVGAGGQAWGQTALGRADLRTRAMGRLEGALLSTTDPDLFAPQERVAFDAVRARCQLTRLGCDCYAYAMVAAGHIDLVIESGLKPYDILALIPIIEGAGGVVTDWRGAPAFAGGQVVAAGSAAVHAEALALLAGAAA
jgi:histidinol phosphatase-like enzyme (inositol monophosphatase family)